MTLIYCIKHSTHSKSLLVAIGWAGVAFDFTSSLNHKSTENLVGGYWNGLGRHSLQLFSYHKSTENLVGGYWPGVHLFPSRTEKLSPEPPMILGSNLVK